MKACQNSCRIHFVVRVYDDLINKDLNNFNKMLRERNIANIIVAKVTNKFGSSRSTGFLSPRPKLRSLSGRRT